MGAHTPGPWRIADGVYPSFLKVDGPSFKLSVVMQATNLDESDYQSRLADLHLIAAAPDLLEALEAAVECGMVPVSSAKEGGAARHSYQVVVADQIRAAIAKARGNT